MSIIESLLISSLLLGMILIILLFIMIVKAPTKKDPLARKAVKDDLKKIKDQISDSD